MQSIVMRNLRDRDLEARLLAGLCAGNVSRQRAGEAPVA